MLGNGDVFGPNQPIILHLLDIPIMMDVLGGVVMELDDCSFPLLQGVVPTADPAVAFKDVAAAFLVGAMPRKQGWLLQNSDKRTSFRVVVFGT